MANGKPNFDKFQIEEEIGRGSLTICYKATHALLGSTVALKVLLQEYRNNTLLVSLFHEKAGYLAKLEHPNIVRVHDLAAEGGDVFAVMEYVRGVKLSDLVQQHGPMDLLGGLQILSGLSEGLSSLHSTGSFHHRLEPHNIMIRPNGTAVIMEFGMAHPAVLQLMPEQSSSGEVLRYLAPEELEQSVSDTRTDLRGLGVTAYYVFTGTFPFDGQTEAEVKARILSREAPPRPSSMRPGFPNELDALILKLLAHEREDRFPDATQLARKVRELMFLLEDQEKTRTMPDAGIEPRRDTSRLTAPQRKLGPYRLIERKGTGSFAMVYMAEDQRSGRMVALKLLKSEFAESEEVIERFRQEVEFARRIRHPNVVHTYEMGVEQNASGRRDLYFTMEFVEGPRLKDLIRRGEPMPVARAIDLARQIALGLQAAHDIGVIHRDLKPANILIDKAGKALIADFGIAVASFVDHRLTATGQLLGTYAYMSPEQALGEEVCPASDIYSLGVILYEMLTGALPYVEGPPLALLKRVVQEPPQEFPAHLDVPPALKDLTLLTLEKDPQDRPRSAAEVAQALEAIGSELEISAAAR